MTGYDSTKEKARLQDVMAFGTDLEASKGKAPPPRKRKEEEEEEIDRFAEVVREIEERREFLQDMAALGQDKPHRNRIMTEISQVPILYKAEIIFYYVGILFLQRIRELEQIDKTRCSEIQLEIH